MDNNFQKTVATEGSLSGVGIHTGEKSAIVVKPAPAEFGIKFFKNNQLLSESQESTRCTSIGNGESQVHTIEHLLAALSGLGISNSKIEVEGPEIPGVDGSALPFFSFLKGLGLVDQPAEREVYKIKEPIFCHEKNRALAVYPSEVFSVAYTLDYDHPRLRNQRVDFTFSPESFEKEVAPARTFCTEEEALRLKEKGFGRGATFQNTLVVGGKGPVENEFRFPDECARHKVLDIVGDLSLLGFCIMGRVVGLRSGHSLNRQLAEEIKKQRKLWKPKNK